MKRKLSFLISWCQALVLIIGFAHLNNPYLNAQPEMNPFNISEDDLNQIVEELNKLSPDQLKELEELGRATEERMRSQNLDPNNPNDWMKFMETEGLMAPQAPQPQEKPQPAPVPQLPQERPKARPTEPKTPMPLAVRSQSDTKSMVNDLINRLESLKQKALSHPSINKRLGTIKDQINSLALYLHLASAPDIITLLSTKDFERLHGTLEELHKGFMSFEPSISARERSQVINEDDPYEVLDLPYSATTEDIEARYNELAAEKSPEAIKGQLTSDGCTTAACKRIIKTAERTFRLIQRSHETLKNPKTRAEVDKTLSDKIAKETKKEQLSLRAFDQLFGIINRALTSGRIVTEVEQLLERFKPQELEQAKLQQQREKEAFERSKRRVIVPQAPPGRERQPGKYEQFYQKMGQDRYGRPRPQPGRPSPEKAKPGKPSPAEKEKAVGKPSAKPGEKKDAAKEKKEEPKKDAKKAAEAKAAIVKPSEKDYATMGEIGSLSKLLEDAEARKGALKVVHEVRAGEEPREEEYKLANVAHDVFSQLTSPGDPAPSAPEKLKRIYDEYQLEKLRDSLMKIAPGKGKKLSEPVKESWKSVGAKYDKLIKSWHDQIFSQIDPFELHQVKHQTIAEAKQKQYNLHLTRIDPWKAKADKEKDKAPEERPAPPSGIDLGKIRDTILSIKTYYDNIKEAAK